MGKLRYRLDVSAVQREQEIAISRLLALARYRPFIPLSLTLVSRVSRSRQMIPPLTTQKLLCHRRPAWFELADVEQLWHRFLFMYFCSNAAIDAVIPSRA